MKQFYIQDTRGCTGNCVLWWARNGAGYTSDLNSAWRVDELKAGEICRCRATDKMWPCGQIDALAERHFDHQRFRDLSAGDPAKESQ